jgi:hypothetical protein
MYTICSVPGKIVNFNKNYKSLRVFENRHHQIEKSTIVILIVPRVIFAHGSVGDFGYAC